MNAATPYAEYPPEAALYELIGGALVTQMVAQVARLGIADQLDAGPLSAEDLAVRVGANPNALYRVMRALATRGVFRETPDGRFESTRMAALLREQAPGSLRTWAMTNGARWYWSALVHAGYSIETGKPAFDDVFGKGTFQYFRDNPEAGELFYATMTGSSNELLPHLLANYDFSAFRHLVDVGGGHGMLLSAILDAHPEAEGTLFDLPFVIDAVEQQHLPSTPPFNLAVGDFFETVSEGGDGYLLKFIIHDWNDEQSVRILRNCRKAMDDEGRVLVIDHVVSPPNAPCAGKMMDLNMLLMEGGRERDADEFEKLFDAAGLRLSRIVPVMGSMSVVEGVPADRVL